MTKKRDWSYGDTKIDRKGTVIYFVGYSLELTKSGNPIELWVPKDIFVKK
jgi:hypothetical protein